MAFNAEDRFRLLSSGQKTRLGNVLATYALLHADLCRLSNRELNDTMNVSLSAIRTHRQLLEELNLLGSIQGEPPSALIRLPNTTRSRLEAALDKVEYALDRLPSSSPHRERLLRVHRAASSIREAASAELHVIADMVDLLNDALEQCD